MIKLEKDHKTYRAIFPVGSHHQDMAFIFSTGSSVSWIAGSGCTDCKMEKFNENDSESFHKNVTSYRTFNVY
jgi:hypothetical protein